MYHRGALFTFSVGRLGFSPAVGIFNRSLVGNRVSNTRFPDRIVRIHASESVPVSDEAATGAQDAESGSQDAGRERRYLSRCVKLFIGRNVSDFDESDF